MVPDELIATAALSGVGSHGCPAVSQAGRTALHKAAYRGHPEVVRTLLARGAELEKRNNVSCLLA